MANNMQYTPADAPSSGEEPTGIASVLTSRIKFIVLGTVALVAFGYFAFNVFQDAVFRYVYVDELIAEADTLQDQQLNVIGALVPFSFQRQGEGSLVATFQLEAGGQQIDATIEGVLDDLFFNPHSEITLHGSIGPDGVFLADQYRIKCPSKYQSLDVENPYDPIPDALTT
ncbi:MAG: cytochrome c maturation protein CcmE [Chloroflexi bacterium]|nr:cytochrome c maturation protein CcmE [Chloroflexota bacterium]